MKRDKLLLLVVFLAGTVLLIAVVFAVVHERGFAVSWSSSQQSRRLFRFYRCATLQIASLLAEFPLTELHLIELHLIQLLVITTSCRR